MRVDLVHLRNRFPLTENPVYQALSKDRLQPIMVGATRQQDQAKVVRDNCLHSGFQNNFTRNSDAQHLADLRTLLVPLHLLLIVA
jgi:hypothetical protein